MTGKKGYCRLRSRLRRRLIDMLIPWPVRWLLGIR